MGSIKATFSAVDVYASNCSNDYVAMINTANEILTRVEKLHTDVQEDYEKISKQIVRLQLMREEVATKVKSYEHKMNEAAAEAERWQAEIDYLYSHPDTVTSTDEDGNETTEEVYDYAAISAAERKRDDVMEIYYLYREKYGAAYAVLVETESTQSRFETIKNAIHAVGESIQSDIYEIKKYISAIGDEAEHNTRSLQGVLGSLSTYLVSKAMFMPAGAIYEDFASSGGAYNMASTTSNVKQSFAKENKLTGNFNRQSTKEKSSFNLKSFIKAFNIKDKIEHNRFKSFLNSKPIIEQSARDWTDHLDSSSEFWGVNGGHYADELNLLLREQGVNDYNKVVLNIKDKPVSSFSGTCGLASLANVLRLLGYKTVTENDIVSIAYNNNLCDKPSYDKKGRLRETGGGTVNSNITGLAKIKGLDSAVSPDLSLEDIDATLQRGGAMMMSVISDHLSSETISRKLERTDHWVTVMGVKKNKYDGSIEGVYIRDTGRHFGDETVFIDAKKFNQMRAFSNDFAGICFFNKERK